MWLFLRDAIDWLEALTSKKSTKLSALFSACSIYTRWGICNRCCIMQASYGVYSTSEVHLESLHITCYNMSWLWKEYDSWAFLQLWSQRREMSILALRLNKEENKYWQQFWKEGHWWVMHRGCQSKITIGKRGYITSSATCKLLSTMQGYHPQLLMGFCC